MKNFDDVIASIVAGCFVAALIGALALVTVARYRECRSHGFSVLYCIR